jgi:DNA-binding transcriptional LysR family regulator
VAAKVQRQGVEHKGYDAYLLYIDCTTGLRYRHPLQGARSVNFTHLLAFFEVARAGSVSGGAERLRVSQPAVTREIRELEERLGLTLFDRLPRGVALTEAGALLFDYAERIFALSGAAQAELKELAGLSAGHLNIGASATVGAYLVPDMIARFNVSHPKVGIDLAVTNTDHVEQSLRDHTVSLGFVEGPYDDSAVHTHPIGADEIVAVAARGHPRAGQRLSASDLATRVVILREPGSGTRAVVEEAYARIGLRIEPLMSISDTVAIKRMLLAQNAIAYVSSLSVKDEVGRGDLCVLEVRDLRIQRPLNMVWLKGRTLSPSTQAFVELVREHFGRSA